MHTSNSSVIDDLIYLFINLLIYLIMFQSSFTEM